VLQRVAEREQDTVGVERLLEEIVGAELRGLHRGLDGAVTRDHHDLGVGVQLTDPFQTLEPVHPFHLDVEEDQVGSELGIGTQRFVARRARLDLDFLVLENLLQSLADTFFVVDDQDAAAHRGAPDRVRYNMTPVGWMTMREMAGSTWSGMAPSALAPAVWRAIDFTAGVGKLMPRMLISRTVNSATPGRSISMVPPSRNGSRGWTNAAKGPRASGGRARVSRRA